MSRDQLPAVTDADIDEALRRAREVDPASSREAVARYLQEIAEMARQFEDIDPGEAPAVACFSADWPSGTAR